MMEHRLLFSMIWLLHWTEITLSSCQFHRVHDVMVHPSFVTESFIIKNFRYECELRCQSEECSAAQVTLQPNGSILCQFVELALDPEFLGSELLMPNKGGKYISRRSGKTFVESAPTKHIFKS